MRWTTTGTDDGSIFTDFYEGSARLLGERASTPVMQGELAQLGAGSQVTLTANHGGARMLLVAGAPLGGPIACYGPFVMNTDRGIHQALEDHQAGRR